MTDESKKVILRPGDTVYIDLPTGESVRLQVEKVKERFLWVPNFLKEDYRQLKGKLLTVRTDRNIAFKAIIAGNEMMERIALTKLISITQPTDNNRREAFRLQKLFDVSVCKKFGDAAEEKAISCQGLDISDTGLGFATSRWFGYGEIIECRFSLDDARYHLTAKVTRVLKQRTDEQEEIYRIGAQFIRIGDNLRKKIRRYIYLQQAARRKGMRPEKDE